MKNSTTLTAAPALLYRQLALLLFISSPTAGYSACDTDQGLTIPEPRIPEIPAAGGKAGDFVPSGWKLAESVSGDFNRDGLNDIALTIVENNPNNIIKNECGLGEPEFDANPYAILVALMQKNAGYRLTASDFKIIPRRDSPVSDQPYTGITAKNGVLSVTYHFWQSAGSWSTSTHTYKFKYQDQCMRLIGHEYHWMQRASGEETAISTNFLTGSYLTIKNYPENNHRTKTKQKLKVNAQHCLGAVPETFEHLN
jgi:hypothetical protein